MYLIRIMKKYEFEALKLEVYTTYQANKETDCHLS